MSDANPDVVPQESVVDFPSDYKGNEVEAEAEETAAEADAGLDLPEGDEGPVSLDAPKPDPEEAEAEPEEGEDNGEEEAPEVIEFDFGGNKLEVNKADVPPELAEKLDGFAKDIWADYTKKSQANAETAKTLKARAEAMAKIESLGGEALDAFTRGKSIKAEIEQLSAVNMQALWQSNPDQARQLTDLKAAKQAELQSIIQAVDQYEHSITQARQEELARRTEEGKAKLDRKIKGFSSEIAPKLEAYVQDVYGMSKEDAASWALSPDVTEMAYKAMLYDQMQKAGKPKVAPKKASPVKAMPNKGGNKHAANANDMSFSELGKLLGLS